MSAKLSSRVSRILKSEGVSGIFHRFASRLKRKPAFHRDCVLISTLDVPVNLPVLGDGIEIKRILSTDANLSELVDFDEWHWIPSETHLRSFLDSGQNCYAAYVAGKLGAYLWTKGSDFDNATRRNLDLGDDELYFFAAFTAPGFRGRGIMPHLQILAMQDARQRLGKLQGLSLIHPDNRSSLSTIAKTGWMHVGYLGYIEVFGLRLHYIVSRQKIFKLTRHFQLQWM